MPSKTISLSLDAYERLKAAKRSPAESFSQVVLRAEWRDRPATAGELLDRWRAEGAHFSAGTLDRLEAAQAADAPPEDKWRRG